MTQPAARCPSCDQHRPVVRATAGRGTVLMVGPHRTSPGGPDCPGSGRQLDAGEQTTTLRRGRHRPENVNGGGT